MPAKKVGRKASGTPRRRRGVKLRPTELRPEDTAVTSPEPEVAALAEGVRADGGAVLATYREPLGGHTLLLVALPIERVTPTPFQRDVSDAHVRRLTRAMDKTRRFLDPVIAVRELPKGDGDGAQRYWVPNGFHRLTALRELGARTVLALLVPERRVAYQILALNIEKAHNLRERALSVVRMYRDLASIQGCEGEESFALELEEPALVTLGFAYEQRPRLSGGAYHPVLRKADVWLGGKLSAAQGERERLAAALVGLDDAVSAVVTRLKEQGLTSPYLKAFVVARVNPLRFMKSGPPPLAELLATMTRRAQKTDAAKITAADVARSGGPVDEDAQS